MTISVHDATGETTLVSVNADDSIESVKRKLQGAHPDIWWRRMRLHDTNDRELMDDCVWHRGERGIYDAAKLKLALVSEEEAEAQMWEAQDNACTNGRCEIYTSHCTSYSAACPAKTSASCSPLVDCAPVLDCEGRPWRPTCQVRL